MIPKINAVLCLLLSVTTGFPSTNFQPTVKSLQQYEVPEWFRDAKFGIYVHWGVYSVAEMGEWYGRNMYEEGSSTYAQHLATYGHPSKFGYKDLIPLWQAEHFDPEAWLDLFAQAGARYFAPCAVHHDGFCLWDTAYTPYNAVNMGPHQDLIGRLRAATVQHGLRFGVTTHFDRTLSWMQLSHGSDTKGPLQGVPYDGRDPRYQDLYMLGYFDHNLADTVNPPVIWREYWRSRIQELMTKYQPDLVYLDSAVPFAGEDNGRTGLQVFAHYYNENQQWHAGRPEGVITYKGDDRMGDGKSAAAEWAAATPFFPGIGIMDIERGKAEGILAAPWQTDDSIGPWGYRRGAQYKDANTVIHKLVDIVSKNGNLLLNVPPRADGTFDEPTVNLLRDVGAWLKLNGEAIYATRPWMVFGEGPVVNQSARANRSAYTASNIRFTRSKDGKMIYAILLGWPGAETNVLLKTFARDQPGAAVRVKTVHLLGSALPVVWSQDAAGLHLQTPAQAPSSIAISYRIETD